MALVQLTYLNGETFLIYDKLIYFIQVSERQSANHLIQRLNNDLRITKWWLKFNITDAFRVIMPWWEIPSA